MATDSWSLAHPDKMREYRAAWKARNADKVRTARNAWREKSPKRAAAVNRLSTNRHRSLSVGARATLTMGQWAGILDQFGQACAYCLRTDAPLEHDHVIAVCRGGDCSEENIVPACHACNRKKGSRPVFMMARYL